MTARPTDTRLDPSTDTRTDTRWQVYDCRVRWSDVDAYGHVNNVKYFEYYQEARIGFLSQAVDMTPTRSVVAARVVVDYKLPVLFRPEPYAVRTRVASRRTSSFELDAQIVDGERVLSTARAVMVAFDATTQASRRLTGDELDRLDTLIGEELGV